MGGPISTEGGSLERFRPGLLLLAESRIDGRMRRHIDPADVVQDALAQAFAKRDQWRGESDAEMAGWLRRILRNKIIDAIRHHQAAKRDAYRIAESVDESFSRLQSLLPASQTSPSQRAIWNEEMIRLPEALNSLLPAQREAIVLHYLHGLTLAEVAESVKRTEPAVAGLLYRGLRKLHQLLEQRDDA